MTDPDNLQRRASDPSASVWVSASAGAGKTKVLSDRVLRLMLAGASPMRLLCLTFTRAAAAEMAVRVNDKLAVWATMPDQALHDQLFGLTGEQPGPDLSKRARRLFAETLDAPGGLKIQTIHGFCQSLLKRFPLEAGLTPYFEVMEERMSHEMLAAAQEDVILTATPDHDPALADALAHVTALVPEMRFQDVLRPLISERRRLTALLRRHGGLKGLTAYLAGLLGVSVTDQEDDILNRALAALSPAPLARAVDALSGGSKTDRQRADGLREAGAGETETRWRAVWEVFFTQKDEPRKTLMTKNTAAAAPDVLDWMTDQQSRLQDVHQHLAGVRVLQATTALITVVQAVIAAYEARKKRRNLLDYDDLVMRTADLLAQSETATAWVLFKLDGGLDHILVDEAQDTNPDQWEVIAALSAEFSAGLGQHDEKTRTLFIVGDMKQSIYSFQRADPTQFAMMADRFEARFKAAEQIWRRVPISVSFRSVPGILAAVDAIFAHDPANSGVTPDGVALSHTAFREKQPGTVTLWPPAPVAEPEPEAPWALPTRIIEPQSPQRRLAAAIAGQIRHWLDHKDILAARDRVVTPGDVLVLVRRRTEFVEFLVSELKQAEIPVAGVDRMRLTEQIAVMDLIALGQFVLLPEDDLNLAALLKSPLLGLDEDALFTLAHHRPGSLWQQLCILAETDQVYAGCHARLSAWLAEVDYQRPYEFFARILARGGGQRALVRRLGQEANDPIDEFLAFAMDYERDHVPSLQGFLQSLLRDEGDVKRDLENSGTGQVRIMTVHGAKGLQAPIVFVADTLSVPDTSKEQVFWQGDEAVLWVAKAKSHTVFTEGLRTARRAALTREYNRLLYVALTRAEDRLILCGWQSGRHPKPYCWQNLCETGLAEITEATEIDLTRFTARGWTGPGYHYHRPDDDKIGRQTVPAPEPPGREVFRDLPGPAPEEPDPPRPLVPSRPDDADAPPPVQSPLIGASHQNYERGLHVHRLLQLLPDLNESGREAAMARYLARPAHGLAPEAVAQVRADVTSVLQDPELAGLFGPGSRAEVPLTGIIGARALTGRIDRLIVKPDEVIIADYKTNRPPPDDVALVAPVYIRQMAVYRAAMQALYPDHAIKCVLIWTHGARAMRIPDTLLDRALPLSSTRN